MADDLNFYPMPAAEMDAALLHGYPSKAEYMCDRNFEQSRRSRLIKSAAIVEGQFDDLDLQVLKAQDPYVVFWTVWQTRQLPRVRPDASEAVEKTKRLPRLPWVKPDENEAVDETITWFVKHFKTFSRFKLEDGKKIPYYPAHYSIMDCLVTWISAQLRQRLKDLRHRKMGEDDSFYYHDCEVIDPTTQQKKTVRVQRNLGELTSINEDGEKTTLLDLIDEDSQIHSSRSRSAIHSRLGDKPTQAICADVMQVIENDPEGKLREIHLKNNPAINAYDILYRMYINHESLSEICRELGVAHPSVNTMVQERAYLYLAQWVLNHREGYEPETLRQVVEANPNGILTKFKAAMRDQSDHRCAHAHVQYFARQFCSCFGQVRSFADVTLELTTKYQYNITPAMVEEFWRTTGTEKLAKAVRLFKVNSHSEKD